MRQRLQKALGDLLSYSGALISGLDFTISLALIVSWLSSSSDPHWTVLHATVITLIIVIIPVRNQLWHEDSELRPIFTPSAVSKSLSRLISFILAVVALVQVAFVLMFGTPTNDLEVYIPALSVMMWLSWMCLVTYVFGIRVICSDKLLALTRSSMILRIARFIKYLKGKFHAGTSSRDDTNQQTPK